MSTVVRLDDGTIAIIRQHDKNLNKGIICMQSEINNLNRLIDIQRELIEAQKITIRDHLSGNLQEEDL